MKEVSIEEAWEQRYPEGIVLVTCVDEKGRPNIIPLGWSMKTSFDPPMVAISVGKTRYSHRLISKQREFVLAFPGEDLKDEVLYCGTHSGKDVDKFKQTGLAALKAKEISPPLIEQCLANMECKVVGELDTGDHTIFCGQILKAYKIGKKLKRLYSLGGQSIGTVVADKRKKGF